MTTPTTTRQMARAEREDLAAFLATLTPEQWNQPTLCADWKVRDVVAHVLSYDELGPVGIAARIAKGWFILNRTNAIGVAEYNTRTPEQLLALLNSHLDPHGLTATFGGMVALVDGLIHHQDIRRSLGRPRDIPPERLRRALALALLAPPVGAFLRARGLRLIATDIDWTSGHGPEIHGPGEAILMAIAGRPAALHELTGPGLATLTNRVHH